MRLHLTISHTQLCGLVDHPGVNTAWLCIRLPVSVVVRR